MFTRKKINFLFISLIIFIISLFCNIKIFAASPQFSIKIVRPNQCIDGRDNDADGKIDYPDDLDCTSPQDDNEDIHTKSSATSSMIYIEGKTIPNSQIKILKDGNVLIYTKSDDTGNFSQSIYGFYYGNYSFGVIAEAKDSSKTSIVNFDIELKAGNYVSVSDVYVAPTISETGTHIIGEDINIEGYGIANSKMQIILFNKKENKEKALDIVNTDKHGYYKYKLDTRNLSIGDYKIYSKNIIQDTSVGASKYLNIYLTKNIDQVNNSEIYKHKVRCDLNDDNNVNLIDFSILLFYWLRSDYVDGDFNSDKIVDVKDFSIMAYNWSGN